jgi:hypothetical protein
MALNGPTKYDSVGGGTIMKLRQMIEAVAATLGDPEPSVNVLAMHLRKTGLITKAGRGMNAADMTPKDAATLFIASLAGGYATETATTTTRVMSAKLNKLEYVAPDLMREQFDYIKGKGLLQDLPYEHSFGEAIESLFAYFSNRINAGGYKKRTLSVEVEQNINGFECNIQVDGRRTYYSEDCSNWLNTDDEYTFKKTASSAGGLAIVTIASALADEEGHAT